MLDWMMSNVFWVFLPFTFVVELTLNLNEAQRIEIELNCKILDITLNMEGLKVH